MTDKTISAASKVTGEQAQAIEVSKLHATATYVSKSPFAFASTKRFAKRVIDLIVVYWALRKDHHQVERIFAESGTPLATPAEDYKEVRRMQGVLGRTISNERSAHAEEKSKLAATIEDLNKQLDVAVRQTNMDRETIRAKDEIIESQVKRCSEYETLNQELADSRIAHQETKSELSNFRESKRLAVIKLNDEYRAEVARLEASIRECENRIGQLKKEATKAVDDLESYKKSADYEVSKAYQGANSYRDRAQASEAEFKKLADSAEWFKSLVEEQQALNIKLAERCASQSEIIAGHAAKRA